MRWKDFAIGTAIGFVCGYATKQAINKWSQPSPDAILHSVKEKIRENGKIIGSWILMKPEMYTKNGLQYNVYKGGVTVLSDDEQQQLEFVADATTGTIIDLR